MKPLTYLLLLLFVPLQSQEIVFVADYTGHEIIVPDSLTYKELARWRYEMEHSKVNFQPALRNIDNVFIVERDRDFLSELKARNIYLNKNLDEFPYNKRAAIIQMLFINQGGKIDKIKRPLVISSFNVTDYTEDTFRRQFLTGNIYKYTVKRLEKQKQKL